MKKDEIIELLKARRKRFVDDNELKRAGELGRILKGIESNQLKDYETLKHAGLNYHRY